MATNMIYFYNLSYDEKTDEFFAFVDDGTRSGVCIFQIDDTDEICDYISTGRMSHIDDVKGLADFLKEQEFMAKDDVLVLNDELLY